jgi:hypothetical protein
MSVVSHFSKKAASKYRAGGPMGLLKAAAFRAHYAIPLAKTLVRRALRGPAKTKTLWIHIGAHKTGSSSLQRILAAERESLMAYSIWHESSAFDLAEHLANRSPLPSGELDRLRAEFRERIENRPEDVIIFSGEYFFGHPDVCYRNIHAVASDLKAITERYPIRLVACVRRQDEFIQSWYHQRVKMGACETFEDYKHTVGIEGLEWDRLLAVYEEFFGASNLRVLVMEQLKATGGNLLETYFGGFGHPFDIRVRPFPRYNQSYSEKALKLALQCYPHLDLPDRKRLRNALSQAFPRQRGEKFTQFTEDERRTVIESYRASNLRFFGKYLGSTAEAERLGYV